MHQLVKSIILIIFFTSLKLYAYIPSEGNVTASYGPFLYRTNFAGSDQLAASPYLGDFGFVTNGDLNSTGSLEIAMFHMNKIYYRNLNTRYLAEKTELLHISLGYRRWLNEKFSVGLDFYSEHSIGQHQILHSESNVDLDIDTSARDTTENGLDFSLLGEVWARDEKSVTLDLRYSYSISNKENEKGDLFSLFLAYKFYVQDKNNSTPSQPQVLPDQIVEPQQEK